MLVLTRKTNQSIMIGDDVEVSVLAVSRDKIRLGISAPREVPVFRKEVYLSIQEERQEEERASANKGAANPNGGSPSIAGASCAPSGNTGGFTRLYSMLGHSAGTVRPGGRLIYATCSSEPDENAAVVDAFLEANSDFSLEPIKSSGALPATLTDAAGIKHRWT